MKREFPLFIVDHNRAHKFGEVDFIYCSDIDNGFIAKVEYIDGRHRQYYGSANGVVH